MERAKEGEGGSIRAVGRIIQTEYLRSDLGGAGGIEGLGKEKGSQTSEGRRSVPNLLRKICRIRGFLGSLSGDQPLAVMPGCAWNALMTDRNEWGEHIFIIQTPL